MNTAKLMTIIDNLIDTAINRLSTPNGNFVSYFSLDIREIFPERKRITKSLIDSVITEFHSRGLDAEFSNNKIYVTVDLNQCFFNYSQAQNFNVALSYSRGVHGNNF